MEKGRKNLRFNLMKKSLIDLFVIPAPTLSIQKLKSQDDESWLFSPKTDLLSLFKITFPVYPGEREWILVHLMAPAPSQKICFG